MIPLLLALLGCGGPAEETLLYELRVVGLVPEPPEVGPGEPLRLTAEVADPLALGFETLVWSCTNLGEGCLEAALPPSERARVFAVDEPPTFEAVAPALPQVPPSGLPVLVWVLACEPGLCSLIDDVRAAPEPGTRAARRLKRNLEDPTAWLVGEALTGVSLASKWVWVSSAPPEERNENPVLEPRFEELPTIRAQEEVRLRFRASDDDLLGARTWAFTTRGGFVGTDQSAEDGTFGWTLVAPRRPGPIELFVTVEDAQGGTALWRTTAEVIE